MEPYLLYCDSSTDGKKSYAFPRDVIKDLNLDNIEYYDKYSKAIKM